MSERDWTEIRRLRVKLDAACRERDDAYDERFALVGEVKGLRGSMREAERLLSGALEPGATGRPVRELSRGELADLETAQTILRAADE